MSRRLSRADSITSRAGFQKPLSEKDKQLITESWMAISTDKDHLHKTMGTHWLHAAERCPMWIWGLIGIDEVDQDRAFEQPAFNALITQIVYFVDCMVVKNELDSERNIEMGQKLGRRHIVYFPEGFQQQYWQAFTLSLHDAITQLVSEPIVEAGALDSRASRLLNKARTRRSQALHTLRHQHKVTDAWHRLLSEVLHAMKDGYTGEVWNLSSDKLSMVSSRNSPVMEHGCPMTTPAITIEDCQSVNLSETE